MKHKNKCTCNCNCDDALNMENIKEKVEDVVTEMKEKTEDVVEQTVKYAKDAKKKYDESDTETKDKVKKGIIGGLTALITVVGLKKIFSKKK